MEQLLSLDHALFKLINQSCSNEFFNQFFPFMTDLHKTVYFNVITLVFIFGIHIYKSGKKGILIGLLCLVTIGINDWSGNQLFKKTIDRQRPFELTELETIQRSPAKPGSSFISSHSSNMFALATFNSILVPATGLVLFPIAALTAYSRVYNGVHFPLDVLSGAAWGFLIGLLMTTLWTKILLPRFKEKK